MFWLENPLILMTGNVQPNRVSIGKNCYFLQNWHFRDTPPRDLFIMTLTKGLALFWRMEGRNLYIFNTGRGHAGYRIGKQSHMRTNYDGWFKSKRINVFFFFKAKRTLKYHKLCSKVNHKALMKNRAKICLKCLPKIMSFLQLAAEKKTLFFVGNCFRSKNSVY